MISGRDMMDGPPAGSSPRVIAGLDPTGDNSGEWATHFLHLSRPGLVRPPMTGGNECVRVVGALARPQTHQDTPPGEHYLAGSAALPTVIPRFAAGIAADTGSYGGPRIKPGHEAKVKTCASGPYPDAYAARPGHDTKEDARAPEYPRAGRRIMRSVRRPAWI